MSNPYFSPSGNPAPASNGSSALMRAAFARVETAFDSMVTALNGIDTLSPNLLDSLFFIGGKWSTVPAAQAATLIQAQPRSDQLTEIADAPVTEVGDPARLLVNFNGVYISATESVAKTLLNLRIGTDVQAYNDGLQQIADAPVAQLGEDPRATVSVNGSYAGIPAEVFRVIFKLKAGVDIQKYDDALAQISSTTKSWVGGPPLFLASQEGSFATVTSSSMRTLLGLEIGVYVQAYSAALNDLSTLGASSVSTVSPSAPNRTIEITIGGTPYYIQARPTND